MLQTIPERSGKAAFVTKRRHDHDSCMDDSCQPAAAHCAILG